MHSLPFLHPKNKEVPRLSPWIGYETFYPSSEHPAACLRGSLGELTVIVTVLRFIYRGLHQMISTQRKKGLNLPE
jgi:hypothetical protein